MRLWRQEILTENDSNGCNAIGGSQGTWPKPRREAAFSKQQIGREIQNRFFSFSIYILKRSSKALSVNINSFCLCIVPINTLCHWGCYQYFHIFVSISTLGHAPCPSFLHKLTSCCKSRKCAKSTTTLNCCMKTWIFCEQCYILLFTKYNVSRWKEKKKKRN